jgi:hypothetical protein
MKTITAAIVVVLAIVLGAWVYSRPAPAAPEPEAPSAPEVVTATFTCDGGKTIVATYHEGPVAVAPEPDQPPTPTSWLEVSIGGAATTTLGQTISADGARFANDDESLVVWNKGNLVLVMRNNQMDLDYTNCAIL